MNREREREILERLMASHRVSVHELAAALHASEPSIRRDLASLEAQHLLRRTHGGAVLEETGLSPLKIPFALRQWEQSTEKQAMADRAAALVKDGDVLFLDASSSVYALLPLLARRKDLTVITNGVKALTALAESEHTVIATGGTVVASCQAMVGDDAVRTVQNYHADLCFFSCRGVAENGDLTDISVAENLVRRAMIDHARHAYLLCAGAKLGKPFFHTLCHASRLSGIISEAPLPPPWSDYEPQ